jgi:hypothetical protein
MMQPSSQTQPEVSARSVYAKWRSLRSQTADHKLHCECGSCSSRRKLGGMIALPYTGAPATFQFKK